MAGPGEECPPVDASRPSTPRVYDCLLGGKDNFAADRDLAGRLEAEAPGLRELARVNRAFVLQSARWAASMLGISQFLDLGCGLPSRPAVHEVARDGCEGARVVYVDKDPMVACHAASLMAGTGLAAVRADAAEAARVLELVADLEVPGSGGRLIGFARPVCVILGGTLSSMPAETARAAVAAYAEALAPGSAVVISCVSYADPEFAAKMEDMFSAAGTWRNHPLADVESFFGGLRVVHGRVADVRCWPMMPPETPAACVLGGIGVREN